MPLLVSITRNYKLPCSGSTYKGSGQVMIIHGFVERAAYNICVSHAATNGISMCGEPHVARHDNALFHILSTFLISMSTSLFSEDQFKPNFSSKVANTHTYVLYSDHLDVWFLNRSLSKDTTTEAIWWCSLKYQAELPVYVECLKMNNLSWMRPEHIYRDCWIVRWVSGRWFSK